MRRIVPVETNPAHLLSFELPVSKSTYNRHRMLHHLAGAKMPFVGAGLAADCRNLDLALNSTEEVVYLGQGGTTLRFYLASRLLSKNQIQIEVDEQLKTRPLKPLLDALEMLGLNVERTWPLLIKPGKGLKSKVHIPSVESSQFVSALALVGAFMENGITIEWTGELVSKSFLNLTLEVLKTWQISYEFEGQRLQIRPGFRLPDGIRMEGDWASASYVIMGAALRKQTICLKNLNENSGQPDEALKNMLAPLGVQLKGVGPGMQVECKSPESNLIQQNFSDCPDLAPTLCVWHLMQGIPIWFTGLQTLNSKESRRLDKMVELLKNMQLDVAVGKDHLYCPDMNPRFPERYCAETEGDHRLAMAFSDLCLRIPDFNLSEVESVDKSFPKFWEEMKPFKIISR